MAKADGRPEVRKSLLPGAAAWTARQAALAEGLQALATAMARSCAEQAQRNAVAWGEAAAARDPALVAQIQRRWVERSLESLWQDASGLQQQWLGLVRLGILPPSLRDRD